MTREYVSVAALAGCLVLTACADTADDLVSTYGGEESRQIKSLSADDIHQLETGGGWGLAKAAELNGVPGPKHILEMKNRISLSAEQEVRVQASFEAMRAQAIPLGKQLVALERELDDAFASNTITAEGLDGLLGSIAGTRKSLRQVHLAAHLEMPAILTPQQIDDYNRIRGYDRPDPCKNIPEGHDPDMWRKHNDCD